MSPAMLTAGVCVLLIVQAGEGRADTCVLSPLHVGLTFPVERVDQKWACRLQPVIQDYTTANKIGPLRTPLPERLYASFLDRPPLAAALARRMGHASYQVVQRGADRYEVSDGEGLEGNIDLVYRDPTSRIYYLDGAYARAWLPRVTGKAVVLIRMSPAKDSKGNDAMDTTMVSYIRLNSRVLAGVASLLRPLIGSGVVRKFTRVVDAANRLSQDMKSIPDRVLEKASAPPGIPPEEMAFLTRALAELRESGKLNTKDDISP